MSKALANLSSTNITAHPSPASMELVCPVATLSMLLMAVDNGADCVCLEIEERNAYDEDCIDFNNQATLNSIRYAHDRKCKVLLSLATRTQPSTWEHWSGIIDAATAAGVNTLVLSDPALMLYAAGQYPQVGLHYATIDSAANSESIAFFLRQFKISRIALPRTLSLAQLAQIARETPAELQVSGFCRLSPAIETSKLPIAPAPKKTGSSVEHCAATESAANDSWFSMEYTPDIRVLQLLPQLGVLGVRAIRIETSGQRPAQAAQTMRVWREAIDECSENIEQYCVKASWLIELNKASQHLRPCPPLHSLS